MYPLPQRQLRSRTINTVAEDLNRTLPPEKAIPQHYLACRYDPFNKTPVKTYIPDGKGKNVVVRDIKLFHNIVVGDTDTFNISIMPWLPFPVGFSINGFMNNGVTPGSSVDGFLLGGVTTGGPAATLSPYLRATFFNALRSSPNVAATGELGNILGARITTIGYRLFYTGTASAAQGLITVQDVNWTVDSVASNNTNALLQFNSVSPPAPFTPDNIPANTAPMMVVGVPSTVTTNTNTTAQVSRPENGIRGILKYNHPADAHEFQPWYEQGVILCTQGQPGTGNTEYPILLRPATQIQTQLPYEQNFVDRSLMGTAISIVGGGSYRLEIVICYEQELSANNALIDMARPSPPINRALLDTDSVLNSTVHPAALNAPIVDLSPMMASATPGGRLVTKPARRRNRRARRRAVRRSKRNSKKSKCGARKN